MEFIESTDWSAMLICVVLVGLLLYVTWRIVTFVSDRSAARRIRANQIAEQIRNQVFATGAEYQDKYMPGRLQAVLDQAWEDYQRLSKEAFDVASEEQVLAMAEEAACVVERIKKKASAVPTDAELEVDSLALQKCLAELEATTAKELAEIEAAYRKKVESVQQSLIEERESIALALEQIAALRVAPHST